MSGRVKVIKLSPAAAKAAQLGPAAAPAQKTDASSRQDKQQHAPETAEVLKLKEALKQARRKNTELRKENREKGTAISELEQKNLELEQKTRDIYDELMIDRRTKLGSQAAYEKIMDDLKRPGRRVDDELKRMIIIFLDLNGLKKTNDHLGYAKGDKLLEGAGSAVLASIRKEDTACRRGGDEIVIFVRPKPNERMLTKEVFVNRLAEQLAKRPELQAIYDELYEKLATPENGYRRADMRNCDMFGVGWASVEEIQRAYDPSGKLETRKLIPYVLEAAENDMHITKDFQKERNPLLARDNSEGLEKSVLTMQIRK